MDSGNTLFAISLSVSFSLCFFLLSLSRRKFRCIDKVQLILLLVSWQIIAPGSNFSLCIVTEQNNIVRNIESIPQPSQGDFLYHRWDLNQWPAPFCRHFNRYATQGWFIDPRKLLFTVLILFIWIFVLYFFLQFTSEKSTVKLSPDAFIEAYSYTGVKETEVRVKQYKDYLSGDIFTNPGLKVRESKIYMI